MSELTCVSAVAFLNVEDPLIQRVRHHEPDEAAHAGEPLWPRVEQNANRSPAANGLIRYDPRLLLVSSNLKEIIWLSGD